MNSPGCAPPRAEFHHASDQCLDHDGTTVTVQLEHVLTGVRVRSGEEQGQAGIDRLLARVQEAGECRSPRRGQVTQHDRRKLWNLRT